jgi:O-methyltransferase
VDCLHKQGEIFEIVKELFRLKDIDGHVVQAGVYKAGCTAKLSIICKILGKNLVAFDSFEGLPANEEGFIEGSYRASYEEAIRNVERFGFPEVCGIIKGKFEDTLPEFVKKAPRISLLFLDVDLSTSTAVCLKYLYPLVVKGGVVFSHDGHLWPVVRLLCDEKFWQEMGFSSPEIEGLGRKKLIKIIKR